MITFRSQHGKNAPLIQIEMASESTLAEVVQTFEGFLKASGYHFDGTLDFVEDLDAVDHPDQ